jgi:hypothetical protein
VAGERSPFSAKSTRVLLVLMLASSAGVHAALVPTHVGEGALVAGGFALSSAALAATAAFADTSGRPEAYWLAALLLGGLLATYLASRVAIVWPLSHAEAVDAIGAATKTFEAAGLLLALRLLHKPRAAQELPARTQGAGS